MKSAAIPHFPRVIIENHQKWLFNPVLKKRYKNRPEERVRLRWVEFLLLQTDWKRTRIGFEAPVKLRQSENQLRADLLLYTDEMQPNVLIECKSPSVTLNASAAEQAARYNSKIGADYVILTNGLHDFCYRINNGISKMDKGPFNEKNLAAKRDFLYWSERGFASRNSDSVLKNWLKIALADFWSDRLKQVPVYLAFKESYLPVSMEHYYKVLTVDEQTKLAVTFIGDAKSGTYLTAVLNRNGRNEAVVTIMLDEMTEGSEHSAHTFNGTEKIISDARKYLEFDFDNYETGSMDKLEDSLMKFF
jgi:hypothetical protein